MDSKKRILVTGGAGFLGSHLCDRLLSEGNEVICVENYFSGSKENMHHSSNHPNFEVPRHDITFPLYIEVDEIYCLYSKNNSSKTFRGNRRKYELWNGR